MQPRSLLTPAGLGTPPSPRSAAIFAKGFRPFFLVAAAFAAAMVPVWLLVLNGELASSPYLDPSVWHAHEMIFGFVVAVIAGFLLTAVANWTQRETLVARPLAMLVGLWLAGRVGITLSALLPRGLPALLDLAFLPALMLGLGRPLIAAKNRRNFVMLGILAGLLLANLIVHLEALGLAAPGSARRASLVSIDLILLMITIISGRVYPMFTRNASGAQTIRSLPRLDAASVVAMALLAAATVTQPGRNLTGALAVVAGLLSAARALHWGAIYSRREPLLWILHAGHAWLVIGLLLRGAAALGARFPDSLATHALTVGAIGSATLGMMARVSLGHSGRMLVPPAPMKAAFAAVNVAAAVRVVGPLLLPAHYLGSLIIAAALWSIAFGMFLVVYAPILSRARLDGRPG